MSDWGKLGSVNLKNVGQCWKLVLNLIIEDNGGNCLIKAKCGKLCQEPFPEVEYLDIETTRYTADNNNLILEDTTHRDQGLD